MELDKNNVTVKKTAIVIPRQVLSFIIDSLRLWLLRLVVITADVSPFSQKRPPNSVIINASSEMNVNWQMPFSSRKTRKKRRFYPFNSIRPSIPGYKTQRADAAANQSSPEFTTTNTVPDPLPGIFLANF
jgi:hypothetical protein